MSIRRRTEVESFRQAACRYCELLESPPLDADFWVRGILSALARLYACANELPEIALDDDAADVPDVFGVGDEEWRRIRGIVRDTLGLQCIYWSYFDPTVPPDETPLLDCGDLADDLADIYRDIKPDLRAWETNNEGYLNEIVRTWKEPLFSSHWGVHAVDAMRALHPLAYLRGVQRHD